MTGARNNADQAKRGKDRYQGFKEKLFACNNAVTKLGREV